MVYTATDFIFLGRLDSGMSATTTGADPPRKAILICPDCDHTSPPDGDWQLKRRVRSTVYQCPCCGSEVVSQPSTRQWSVGSAAASMSLVPLWAAYLRGLDRYLDR